MRVRQIAAPFQASSCVADKKNLPDKKPKKKKNGKELPTKECAEKQRLPMSQKSRLTSVAVKDF